MEDFGAKVLISGDFVPQDVIVALQPSNRQIDNETENQIERVWREKVAGAERNGKLLYNGLSYRLNSYRVVDDKLFLDLGTLEYKVRDGLIAVPRYLSLPESYWRKGLYSTATVRTSDAQYLMVELSGKSMNTNTIDLIGGVVETEPKIHDGNGIFESFLRELEEEALVAREEVESCRLKSLMQERRGNITLYFEVLLRLSSADLRQRYAGAALENDIKAVAFFNRDEYLETLRRHNPNKQLVGQVLTI